jgi:type II secretory pathway component PulC
MSLLCFSACLLIVFLVFAVWTYGRVQVEKVFTFESEPVSVPSITVNVDALKQTIELFEKKKVRFDSIRQIGVDAFDPSL